MHWKNVLIEIGDKNTDNYKVIVSNASTNEKIQCELPIEAIDTRNTKDIRRCLVEKEGLKLVHKDVKIYLLVK